LVYGKKTQKAKHSNSTTDSKSKRLQIMQQETFKEAEEILKKIIQGLKRCEECYFYIYLFSFSVVLKKIVHLCVNKIENWNW
jgi:hypothetical protein